MNVSKCCWGYELHGKSESSQIWAERQKADVPWVQAVEMKMKKEMGRVGPTIIIQIAGNSIRSFLHTFPVS